MTGTTHPRRRSSRVALVAMLAALGASMPAALADETGPRAGAPVRPASALPGIDVSHWQDSIDWSLVAASGVRFAIAKATEGTSFVDPMYAVNKAGAAANGVPFTAYHFAKPDASYRDAVREANHFVAVADLGPGDLVPALDLERTGGLSPRELTRWVLRWLGRVTDLLGVRPMVYTGPNGWSTRTGDTTAVADAGYTVLWLAHWDVAGPAVPGAGWAGNGWTFWQFTDCASVPGIEGCVDGDWFAGPSLERVTISSPDVRAPAAAITPPADLGGPAVVSFSEAVHDVTPGNVVLWQPDTAQPVAATLACASRTGAAVDCALGPVRTATLRPERPLPAGQEYSVLVDPDGVLPAVTDAAGNALAASSLDFATPARVEQDSSGIVYGWASVRDRRAVGRGFATERAAGARFSYSFPGRSITWYTVVGPAQGRAEVFVDGRSQGVFDQYARRTAFGVGRRFSGLSPGWHTIAVEALGTHARAATDARVAVDAFAFGGGVVADPSGTSTWRTADVAAASGGAVAVSNTPGASASFTLRGTGVEWTTLRGPGQGRAAIYVDGELVRTVDDRAAVAKPDAVRSVRGLIIGEHTLRIVVLGDASAGAGGGFVAVDALTVIP